MSIIPASLSDFTAPTVTPPAPNLASVKDDIEITSAVEPPSSAPLNTILVFEVPSEVIPVSPIVNPPIVPSVASIFLTIISPVGFR